ncbi:DUF3866 family protein [Acetohalobium arabaticum]|uniref:DUF3866 domain-containing protein n=1 Tax=Acetohalobium arabaticum (strain ATCC 49924 / DSM 5501 / Z-7288) TaxID=574087 RepID=D9QRS9_ACEAZ|nr:DUF3866 family protein [Acetohalobium arabaticum]ADL13220.1 conserved hypothetical protein [Acetohalobium arabaticum DSM 5501]
MLAIKRGKIAKIIKQRPGLTEVEVELKTGEKRRAINYDDLTGEVSLGDEVILNTTAVELDLGTGGYDFIIYIEGNEPRDLDGLGHIMKLRYSPFQLKTLSVEEEASSWQQEIKNFTSLEGNPVIIGSLHSMLAPTVIVLNRLSNFSLQIAYIMTDAAALPLKLSNTVAELQQKELLDTTITIGHAFGGDLEAVNIYSGLAAAKEVAEADVIIVAMGPGVVGTGTKYGFSGIEQGEIINAVSNLGGIPLAIPRISFSDERKRHYGFSHHTLTVLEEIALREAVVGVPKLSAANKQKRLNSQLIESNLNYKHDIRYRDGSDVLELISNSDIGVNTMGRDETEDPEFFMTAGITGVLALEELGVSL